jgi:hypothetical protein
MMVMMMVMVMSMCGSDCLAAALRQSEAPGLDPTATSGGAAKRDAG